MYWGKQLQSVYNMMYVKAMSPLAEQHVENPG